MLRVGLGLTAQVTAKGEDKASNPRLLIYMYSFMFQKKTKDLWKDTGLLCKASEKALIEQS